MDVRADQSMYLKRDLERGDLDLALFKRDASEKGGIASWPERVHWVTSKSHPRDIKIGSVPLIGFPAGCLYRARAIHALESAGRAWHMAYTSSSLAGIQAAVAAGMGLSILSEMAIQADHRVLTAKRRLCADRQDRSGAGRLARRQAPRRCGSPIVSPSSATTCRRRRRSREHNSVGWAKAHLRRAHHLSTA